MKPLKPTKAWMVRASNGGIYCASNGPTRELCISRHESDIGIRWNRKSNISPLGDKLVRVEITEIKRKGGAK